MIQLNSFRLTPQIYYRVILRRRFQKSWWLYLLCMVFALRMLFLENSTPFTVFMIVFGLTYPLLVVVYYYFWVSANKNNSLFTERDITLENERLVVSSEGMSSELYFKQIQKVIETADYFLLYIARSQFVYLPKTAFTTVSDIQTFKELINKDASSNVPPGTS